MRPTPSMHTGTRRNQRDERAKKDCFEISVSKTFHHPIEGVLECTKQWLKHEQRAKSTTQCGSNKLKCDWSTDGSCVALNFLAKGKDKTQVVVMHERIGSKSDAVVMRNFWKENIKGMAEAF